MGNERNDYGGDLTFSATAFNVGTGEEHYYVLVERKPDSQYTARYLHSVVAHASKAYRTALV